MNADIRTRLTQVFADHAALLQAETSKRIARDEEASRAGDAFRQQFEACIDATVLPLFDELREAVRENGHGCTVTRATHGAFFDGPDEGPGIVFMFYPGSVPMEEYVFKPVSSYVAVFADPARQQIQVHRKAVRPGGFAAGELPALLPLTDLTREYLAATCIGVIEDTLHRMEA